MATHDVVLIPGDGIGPEVTGAVRYVLSAAGADIAWKEHRAGLAAIEHGEDVLPERTLDAIRQYGVALKGPCTTPVGKGFVSVNVRLRKALDLYAAVRPVRSSSRMRSKMSTLASTAMPIESTKPPMPASVRVTGTSLNIASTTAP